MTILPHLHIALTEVYDREGFTHQLPVTLIVDRANFGTITLEEAEHREENMFVSLFPQMSHRCLFVLL